MTIKEKETEIIDAFGNFDDWLDKYNYIIDMGRELPLIAPQYKTKQYLISGCQSSVWLHAEYLDGKIYFTADSDAVITKGIVNLLIGLLSGQTPDAILSADMGFVEKIGLKEHLSPTRSNGLMSMIKQIKLYALAFKTKHE
ncbi:MAG: Fe-S metabolism protein SufE [Bacteroidetes bacterium 4572_114]|nr:MAG: Fe-S metabolism protein SufE [Bacteroidetes bacterium 4572_114]